METKQTDNKEDSAVQKPESMPANDSQPPEIPQANHISFWKKILIVIGGLLGLIAIGILILVVTIKIEDRKRNNEIAEQAKAALPKVTSARAEAEKKVDATFASQMANLQTRGLVDKQIASSKVDVCYVDSGGSVTVTQNWYQDCYLRYVNGYSTSLSKADVLQKLALVRYSDSGELIPVPPSISPTNPCYLNDESDHSETLRYRPSNSPTDRYDDCGIPDPLRGLISVPTSDSELGVKTFHSFDPKDIDNSQNQVWLEFDQEYYHEDLGCGTGFLCDSPRKKPVQAP